jgi:integrase
MGKGPRRRIRGEYGSLEFNSAYHAAIAGTPDEPAVYGTKTLGWLIEQYRDSGAWRGLALATRRQREQILRGVIATAGNVPFAKIDQATIKRGMERRGGHAAWHFLKAMRGLFAWAVDAQHAKTDPTSSIKTKRPKIKGHPPWPTEWCEAFEQHWPLGTRERVAYDVFIYTGLRLGDAVRLGRPHVRDGVIQIRLEKSGEEVMVTLPILPPLQRSLDAGPIGELTFIAGERRRPMVKEACGNWFRKACRAAGVPGSAHGLRKAAATRAADNGATEAQLEAIFGWRGGQMAALYTREANRKRLAREHAVKLLSEHEANIYARTLNKVRGKNPKTV